MKLEAFELTRRGITSPTSLTVDVLGPDLRGMSGIEILNIVAVWHANSIGCTQEIVCQSRDLSAVGDGDGTVVAVSVVVARLLVVLELLCVCVSL